MSRGIGISLLAIGIIMLLWAGFTYTKKEKVVDAGLIQISANKGHTINWPYFAGGRLIISGIALLRSRKSQVNFVA